MSLPSEMCDQVRLEPACSVIEDTKVLGILDIATIGVILSRQQTSK